MCDAHASIVQPDGSVGGIDRTASPFWQNHTESSASTGREYGADKTGEPHIPANSATGDASLRRSEAAPTAPDDIPPPGGGVFLFPKWLPYLLAGASIVVSVGALLGWW